MDFLSPLEGKVTKEMRENLSKEFVAKEISIALKQMHPNKAPGLDGMSPIFFQKYWGIVGSSVSAALLRTLNSSQLPSHLNHTLISLIPKIKQPSKVIDFCPISLCNVLYKLLSKVLSNRLKPLLAALISESHSNFVLGRQVSYNILVADEIVHFLKRQKKKEKRGRCP